MTQPTTPSEPVQTITHDVLVSVHVQAAGLLTASAARITEATRLAVGNALDAYDPMTPGATLYAPDPPLQEHATDVGYLRGVTVTAQPVTGLPAAVPELLRDYCREFGIATEDQAAHVTYLIGLMTDVLASTDQPT